MAASRFIKGGKSALVKSLVLDNPYLPLCTPPVLIVLQFLVAMALFRHGLPESMTQSHVPASLLITSFFALCAPALPAILLGLRNVIYNANKLAPALGIAANIAYLISFVGFFLLFFVVKTTY